MTSVDETEFEAATEVIDILLVEPNPGDTRLFEENVRDAKLVNEIHTVTDGDAALDFIRQRNEYADAPRPDVVLLEPQLPGTNGADVYSALMGESAIKDVPVVALTSSDAGEEIVKSHGFEADVYIQKPIEAEEFISFVQQIEDFWFAIVKNQGGE